MAVTITYAVMYAISLWLILLLVKQKEYVQAGYFMIIAALTIMNAGYLIEIMANNLGTAIFGFRLSHFGEVFIPLLLMSITAKMVGVKVKAWIKIPIIALAAVVYILASTINRSEICFKNAKLVRCDGFSTVEVEYGHFYFLFALYLCIIAVVSIWLIVEAVKNSRKISKNLVLSLIFIQAFQVLLPILDIFIAGPVRISAFSPALSMAVVMYLIKFFELHDIDDCVATASGNLKNSAYIVFDSEMRFINASESAKEAFPRLRKLKTDKKVPHGDSTFDREIVHFLEDTNSTRDEKLVVVKNNYYVVKKSVIKNGPWGVLTSGYLIELQDVTANNSYLNELNKYNKELEKEIEEKKQDVASLQEKLVLGMAILVESRDNTTGEHIIRTRRVVSAFADVLLYDKKNINAEFLEKVVKAVPMHDLGKIAVDDKVLRKTGKYDDSDFAEMRKHPAEGARIVRKILAGNEEREFSEIAANIANYHHERWDGKGYPDGLRGEEIPLEARIMSLADALDAILSERAYDWPHNFEEAFRIIEENLGTQFDPNLGEVFVRNKEAFEAIYAPLGKVD